MIIVGSRVRLKKEDPNSPYGLYPNLKNPYYTVLAVLCDRKCLVLVGVSGAHYDIRAFEPVSGQEPIEEMRPDPFFIKR